MREEFESDVISDGTQTILTEMQSVQMFESDVISDGTQTRAEQSLSDAGLRVM